MNVNNWIKESNYSRKMVLENTTNSSKYRWLLKKVYKKDKLWNNLNLDNVLLKGIGKLSYDTSNKAILLEVNDDVENLEVRPNTSIVINLDSHNFNEYNRLHLLMKPVATGFVNFYAHFAFGNETSKVVHTCSVIPNVWNDVLFEVGDVLRDNVLSLSITPFLFGTPPEAVPNVSFLVKDVYIEKVDLDDIKGWSLKDRIAYSHVGYFKDYEKIAIIENEKETTFKLKDEKNKEVYTGLTKKVSTNLGNFQIIDFSSFHTQGSYYIEVLDTKSNLFLINDNPYLLSIWKSLQFLRTLRCGVAVENVHSACHLNCRGVSNDGRSVPCFGGWHDAGDVSQFEICTAEMADAILNLENVITDASLKERLKEEAKVGIDWLLQTTFEDGNRALAITYKMWRKNILYNTNKGVSNNVCENGPFENFLACSALLNAYKSYDDEIYKAWCLRIALIDFSEGVKGYENKIYTKRWGPNIDATVCGIGAVCASRLYEITSDESYKNIAIEYGKIIMACQETTYHNSSVRGYFYEDPNHTYLLTFEHRGHEQSPIEGIVSLCNTFKDSSDYDLWVNTLKLYKEYITDTMKYTAPYNLICGHVYDINKLNLERFTIPANITKDDALKILQSQIKKGIKLSDTIYLRIFPIAIQRRGFHATLLSKTKAVSLIASFFNDSELKQIVVNQLEWILGKNPFSSSTMYGEGYNYHPLYVAYSPQLIGALPVGIMTKGDDDEPYWPTVNNAVYKEVWGHTTGKYLAVIADILKE